VQIVHIDTGPEMRGGQYQVLLLLSALQNAGHQLTLLARKGSPLFVRANQAGFRTVPASLLSVLRCSAAADIVHVHDARAHFMASVAARAPFVVSRRVAFPVKRSPASRWKYARAVRYLAVSRFVAKVLQEAGVNPEKIDVVYDAAAEAGSGAYDRSAPAVAPASADPQKGRDLVTAAAGISHLPVRFSENLTRDLQRASMLVYITRSEGLGSAALLAMAMGIPVVASYVGGLAEVFEHGISGLYTTNEPHKISEAMLRLLQCPGLAERLIVNAKLRVQERFSVKAMLQSTLASYKRALNA
jgi:Glycosyl transferases group 1/Glycosyltransferase Family 4